MGGRVSLAWRRLEADDLSVVRSMVMKHYFWAEFDHVSADPSGPSSLFGSTFVLRYRAQLTSDLDAGWPKVTSKSVTFSSKIQA